MPADRPIGLGLGDVLTVREAVRALRIAEAEGRRWLETEGLIRHVAGRPRVIWGDVVARIRAGEPQDEKPETRPRLRRGRL
jgi:hypothetical protein